MCWPLALTSRAMPTRTGSCWLTGQARRTAAALARLTLTCNCATSISADCGTSAEGTEWLGWRSRQRRAAHGLRMVRRLARRHGLSAPTASSPCSAWIVFSRRRATPSPSRSPRVSHPSTCSELDIARRDSSSPACARRRVRCRMGCGATAASHVNATPRGMQAIRCLQCRRPNAAGATVGEDICLRARRCSICPVFYGARASSARSAHDGRAARRHGALLRAVL